MKKTIKLVALALVMSLTVISCKKKISDADLTTKASEAISSYAGTSVSVKEGKVELSGIFADEASKKAAVEALKKVEGIKDVADLSTIAEVVKVVSAVAPEVVSKVNDALKDFPTVKAEVVADVLTLTGTASPDQARKIKMSIDALKIGKYENKLEVK